VQCVCVCCFFFLLTLDFFSFRQYAGSTYPLFLDSARRIAQTLGDSTAASALDKLVTQSSKDFERAMFNGNFFSYGCALNGSARLDSTMFSGQLAGQFMARVSQWPDIVSNWSHIVSAMKAQLVTNVNGSEDFYAPKVWDMTTKAAMVDPHNSESISTCWPFYLEDYVAMNAIAAGFLADGLDVMKHIQLVNARKGLTWRQNLWSPNGDTTVSKKRISTSTTNTMPVSCDFFSLYVRLSIFCSPVRRRACDVVHHGHPCLIGAEPQHKDAVSLPRSGMLWREYRRRNFFFPHLLPLVVGYRDR